MSDIKLVVCDLDGTLLNDKKNDHALYGFCDEKSQGDGDRRMSCFRTGRADDVHI